MPKLLRINMSDASHRLEDVPKEYRHLGGRALSSTIIAREVDPGCSAVGPSNKLVLSPGLLSGTSAPSSGRLSVGGKSPLTGTIKESNAGGQAGQYIARLDIAAVILEGWPKNRDDLYCIHISKDGVDISAADELMGFGNYATVEKITEKYGEKVAVISIGQAGEMRLAGASVAVTDKEMRPTRHAGRGGMGSVMGSKGVKAIIIDPSGGPGKSLVDKETFKACAKTLAKALNEHPFSGNIMRNFGTPTLVQVINEVGGLPTRNFSEGRFDGVEKISGDAFKNLIVERKGTIAHACMSGCIIKCSAIYVDKNGDYISKRPEFETIGLIGPNCGIGDPDAIARIDRACDDVGVDTMETGAAIGVAMEAGVIPFGDSDTVENLVKEISQGTPMGRIIASGTAVTGQIFGVYRVPVVKNQGIPSYEPRAIKGIGVTYATSTMGADHTAGYVVGANLAGVVDPLKPEGQALLSKKIQTLAAMLFDSTGLCLFCHRPTSDNPEALKAIVGMINAVLGVNLGQDDIFAQGRKILQAEWEFNKKAGFTAAHDRLPEFMTTEPIPSHGTVFDVSTKDLDSVMDFEF